MHGMPSVACEASYKRRDKPWEGNFWLTLLLYGQVYVIVSGYELQLSLVRQSTLERGLLSQGELTSIIQHTSSIVQPHCSSRVHKEGEYTSSRFGGQLVGHYIWPEHINIHTWSWMTTRECKQRQGQYQISSQGEQYLCYL